jgi:hypothetical protein
MIRKLVDGRIVFTPDREARRYTFRATGTLANLISGIVCPQVVTSPTGVDRADKEARCRDEGDTNRNS